MISNCEYTINTMNLLNFLFYFLIIKTLTLDVGAFLIEKNDKILSCRFFAVKVSKNALEMFPFVICVYMEM